MAAHQDGGSQLSTRLASNNVPAQLGVQICGNICICTVLFYLNPDARPAGRANRHLHHADAFDAVVEMLLTADYADFHAQEHEVPAL